MPPPSAPALPAPLGPAPSPRVGWLGRRGIASPSPRLTCASSIPNCSHSRLSASVGGPRTPSGTVGPAGLGSGRGASCRCGAAPAPLGPSPAGGGGAGAAAPPASGAGCEGGATGGWAGSLIGTAAGLSDKTPARSLTKFSSGSGVSSSELERPDPPKQWLGVERLDDSLVEEEPGLSGSGSTRSVPSRTLREGPSRSRPPRLEPIPCSSGG